MAGRGGDTANDAMAAVERDIVDSIPDAAYVDLTDRFRSATACHAFLDGKLAFRDQHHMATPFADRWSRRRRKG
ncbi:MAG: hypothetical protein E5V37_34320 [Mesorhizobium sp.]|nr:MAG: hypothetical protein E5V37_34320 [Mesorhizobium sp.]